MENLAIGGGSALTFACPRCGDSQTDDFEILDLNTPTDWRCEACARLFNVRLTDCMHCGAETVSVALNASEQPQPSAVCPACGKAAHGDEGLE